MAVRCPEEGTRKKQGERWPRLTGDRWSLVQARRFSLLVWDGGLERRRGGSDGPHNRGTSRLGPRAGGRRGDDNACRHGAATERRDDDRKWRWGGTGETDVRGDSDSWRGVQLFRSRARRHAPPCIVANRCGQFSSQRWLLDFGYRWNCFPSATRCVRRVLAVCGPVERLRSSDSRAPGAAAHANIRTPRRHPPGGRGGRLIACGSSAISICGAGSDGRMGCVRGGGGAHVRRHRTPSSDRCGDDVVEG